MIAAGLMMLGGCFAQDASGAVVDTYWQARSVRPKSRVSFSVSCEECDVTADSYFALGRLENSTNIDSKQSGQVLYWGSWASTPFSTFLAGTKGGAWASFQTSKGTTVNMSIPGDEPVLWSELKVENQLFTLASVDGADAVEVSLRKPYIAYGWFWNPLIQTIYGSADVAAYAGRSSLGGYRFNILPMRSVSAAEAYFDVDNSELIEI